MAVKTILCPVELRQQLTPRGRRDIGWYPSLHALSLGLTGRSAGAAIIGLDPGGQHPACVYTVWADAFADLDNHPDAVDFGGVPKPKLSEYIQHLDAFPFDTNTKREDIQAKALQIGLTRSLTGRSVGAVLREFLAHLEPAASDDMYERVIPADKQTITDNFNRASLGGGWVAGLGPIWVTNGDVTARHTDDYAIGTLLRSEASFPDNQYAQVDTEFTTGDGGEGGAIIRSATSTTFYHTSFFLNAVYLYRDVPSSYVSDATVSLAAATLATVKLTGTGTTITVDFNGSQVISVTDSNRSAGTPGMHAHTNDLSLTPDFDNFECTDAVGVSILGVLIGEPLIGSSIF